MDIKVNELSRVVPVENQTKPVQTDGSFKFILASNVEDAELNSRLNSLLTQITEQGERIAQHTDMAYLFPNFRLALTAALNNILSYRPFSVKLFTTLYYIILYLCNTVIKYIIYKASRYPAQLHIFLGKIVIIGNKSSAHFPVLRLFLLNLAF